MNLAVTLYGVIRPVCPGPTEAADPLVHPCEIAVLEAGGRSDSAISVTNQKGKLPQLT